MPFIIRPTSGFGACGFLTISTAFLPASPNNNIGSLSTILPIIFLESSPPSCFTLSMTSLAVPTYIVCLAALVRTSITLVSFMHLRYIFAISISFCMPSICLCSSKPPTLCGSTPPSAGNKFSIFLVAAITSLFVTSSTSTLPYKALKASLLSI